MDGRHKEAAAKAEAYSDRVRDEQQKTRTVDRRRRESLSEENREAQRRRLDKNVVHMSTEGRERQQAGNQWNKETAACDVCGAAKTSSEYVKNQWHYRKQTVPTWHCRECQLKRKREQYGERSSARQRSKRN